MLSVEELVKEISGKSGKSTEEVNKLIEEKQTELSGLVSVEGAAYIIGRELGVGLIKENNRQLKIKNIVPDMRTVDVVARVINIFGVREFERNGKKGSVSSIILGDETGTIRLPLWNDEIKLLEIKGIKQDDMVEVTSAWSKSDNREGTELRMGKRGMIKKLEGGQSIDLKDIKVSSPKEPVNQPATKSMLNSVQPGMTVQISACLVQAYKRKPYFEVCSQCNGRVEEKDGKFECKDHGVVEPAFNLLLSTVVDDGSSNIRAVFFREQAEQMFGKGADEVKKEFDELGPDAFYGNFAGLGRDYIIEGRIKKNDFSGESELMVSSVKELDPEVEGKELLKALKK